MESQRQWWTAPQVARIAGCSYRQVDYWCRTGLIDPTAPARGSGSSRRFDAEDVEDVVAIAALSRFGLSLSLIRRLSDVSAAWVAVGDAERVLADLLVDESAV